MKHLATLAIVLAAAAGCVRVPPGRADAMTAIPKEPLGEDRSGAGRASRSGDPPLAVNAIAGYSHAGAAQRDR